MDVFHATEASLWALKVDHKNKVLLLNSGDWQGPESIDRPASTVICSP